MRTKTDLPFAVREIENAWIPLSDGAHLAARIWLPANAEREPVPAILEYVPYRKNDFTALKDSTRHPYFAGHGYAGVRVDLRGSGDSDGILSDEYLKQEQDDALEVIAWLAAQPWCTGAVGMMGYSWGGFNSLQVAARRPPALKAVISVASTDDRYADDTHYIGGCVLASDLLPWASSMLAYNARPPDPRFVGERWREMWLDRLNRTPPYIEAWLSHQRRDPYWTHGSICENYNDVVCPVMAVNGWADGYPDTVLRLLANLSVPRLGIIGPWAHYYPHEGLPGPAIGFLQECLRWWDHWLIGVETGILEEPVLRVWMQASIPPSSDQTERPGRWVVERTWPSPNITMRSYALNRDTLDEAAIGEERLDYRGLQTHGLDAGTWWSWGCAGDFPADQRFEDGSSFCFTSAPVTQPMEILGFPEARLTLSVDRPNALLAVRLDDVSPTGESLLVSRGLLNLTHRESDEHPAPLEPGRRYTVSVHLKSIAHSLPAGHRWRLAISPTYWPFVWPSPEPVTLGVYTGEASCLLLPMREAGEDAGATPFGPAEGSPTAAHEVIRVPERSRVVKRDISCGHTDLVDIYGAGYRLMDNDVEYEYSNTNTYGMDEGDPLSASVHSEWSIRLRRGDWRVRIETSSRMTSDAEVFRITNQVDAYEGNTRIFSKPTEFHVPRDLV
jgi:uncharacterized protein